MELTWTTSASADDDNHDQETELDTIGNPGGAVWASVSPDPRYGWVWEIFGRWLDADDDPQATIDVGTADDEAGAKAAVQSWADSRMSSQAGE
jgi:hypothetical protein